MGIFREWIRVSPCEGTVLARASLAAPWRVHVPPAEQGCFHFVLSGQCWVQLPGDRSFRLDTGDLVLVPRKRGHDLGNPEGHSELHSIDVLAKAAGLTPAGGRGAANKDGVDAFAHSKSQRRSTSLFTGVFSLAEFLAEPILRILPPLLHLPVKSLRGSQEISRIMAMLSAEAFDESGAARPPALGTPAMVQHLFGALFIYVAREWAKANIDSGATLVPTPKGAALPGNIRSEAIGKALSLMHAEPARQWTVSTLAVGACVSRAAFARRFVAEVGHSPLSYLTHWRMALAQRALRRTDLTVEQVALSVGYQSVSAFSRAYRRVTGQSPRRMAQPAGKPSPSRREKRGKDAPVEGNQQPRIMAQRPVSPSTVGL